MKRGADFILRLIDKVSGPAKKAVRSMANLQDKFKSLQGNKLKGLIFGAQGRTELGRFTAKSKGLIGHLKELGSTGASAFIGMAKWAGVAAVAAGGVAVAFAGRELLRTADYAQRAAIGFQAVAKHGASAEKLFSHARTEAQRLGLDVFGTTDAFKGFLSQGADPAMATNLVRMGADMKALGVTNEQVKGSFAQINKILTQGKLQGDELAILAENSINVGFVFEEMAKRTGKSIAELQKMQQTGNLTADIALPSLIAAVTKQTGGKEAGDAGARIASETLSGMGGVLKAQAQNLWIDVARDSTPALVGALKPLGDEISKILSNPATREGLVSAITTVADAIRDAIPFVKTFLGAFGAGAGEAFSGFVSVFKDLFGSLKGNGAGTTAMLKIIGHSLGQLAVFAGAVGVAFGALVLLLTNGIAVAIKIGQAWFNTVTEMIGRVIAPIANMFANIAAIFDAEGLSLTDKIFAIGKQVVMGLVKGITAVARLPVDAVRSMATNVKSAFENALKIGSPSRVFEQYGQWSVEGFELGIADGPANDNFRAWGPSMADAYGAAPAPVAAGGAGASVSNTFQIRVEVQAAPGEDAEKVGRDVGRGIRAELADVLEELVLETGS